MKFSDFFMGYGMDIIRRRSCILPKLATKFRIYKFNNNTKSGMYFVYSENPSVYILLDITNSKIILSILIVFFSYPILETVILKNAQLKFQISNFIPDHEISGDSNTCYNESKYDINNNYPISK